MNQREPGWLGRANLGVYDPPQFAHLDADGRARVRGANKILTLVLCGAVIAAPLIMGLITRSTAPTVFAAIWTAVVAATTLWITRSQQRELNALDLPQPVANRPGEASKHVDS